MLSRGSFWRLCSIKNMFYTLSLISLCVALHVWIFDVILDFTDMRFPFSLVSFFSNFVPNANTKFILSWDQNLISNVTDRFQKFNCSVKNCVFSTNKELLSNLSSFDAIVFGENILTSENRPKERDPHQLFVFMSIESYHKYPACEIYNDDYFNWTFTYRFDSDVLWRHFVVRDRSGAIVAPSSQVVWKTNDSSLRSEIKTMLRTKMRAVVWMVDDYNSEAYEHMLRLEKHLNHFSLKLYKHRNFKKNSVYSDVLVQNYQFVLVFDNWIAKNYVSKKVMDGFRNYAVPIVYRGGSYSRYLPPGSYINADEKHPYNLAHTIYEASKNSQVYERYFKWTNMYSIEEWGAETSRYSSLCDLCKALHGDRAKHAPAKKKFRVWWNFHNMHLCLKNLPTRFTSKNIDFNFNTLGFNF